MFKRSLGVVLFVLMACLNASAQISVPNTLVAGTTIRAADLNTNFTYIADRACNVGGCTLTATINVRAILPTTDATYALGDGTHRFTTGSFSGAVTAASFAGAISGTTGTFSSTLDVTGNFSVNTNKFNVTAVSGNTSVAGTLGVTGASTLAALSATTGTFSSTLGVTGAATFSSTVATGALTVTGTATATTFSGSGASLTSVPAGQLSGTITSATQDLITRTGTVVSGTWSGSFGIVSGANLTNLTAANIAAGTITATFVGNLTGNVTGNVSGTAPAGSLTGATLAANVTASSLTSVGTISSGTWSGSFGAVSGANLTSLSAGNLSGTITSATQDLITRTGTVTSGTWSGLFGAVSGANLTTLNASNISSGSLADARLSANIPKLDTAQTFTQKNTFSTSAIDYSISVTNAATGHGLGISAGSSTSQSILVAADSTGTNIALHARGDGSVVFNDGGALIDSNGDYIPAADSTKHVGVPSARFAYMTALAFNLTDALFDNGWAITEAERIGIPEEGLAVVNKKGELMAFFGESGTYLKGGQAPKNVDDLPYHLTTIDQRIHMDRTPEIRIKGHDVNGKPIHKTKADVPAFPNPATAKSNNQRRVQ